jgi:hypothetical protein
VFPRQAPESRMVEPFMEAAGIEPAQDSPGVDLAAWFFECVYARRDEMFAGPAAFLYFIQEEDREVKIGRTQHSVDSRLRALQTANPSPLQLLSWAPGTAAIERLLHGVLLAHHVRGEWFRPSPAILEIAAAFNDLADACYVGDVISKARMQSAYLEKAVALNSHLPSLDPEWDAWEPDDA